MVVFSESERELARCVYRDVADAVASAMVRRQASPGSVFVAAYSHRFGVDLTAHATHEGALMRLASVATRECARDPELRDRVTAQFGCWPAQRPSLEVLEAIVDSWGDVSAGESLWIAECEVQEPSGGDVRPVVHSEARSEMWSESDGEPDEHDHDDDHGHDQRHMGD